MCSPSNGFRGTPEVARTCVYTVRKIVKITYKNVLQQEQKKMFNEHEVGMLLQKEQIQKE